MPIFSGTPRSTSSGALCASLMVIDGTSLRVLLEERRLLYGDPEATLPPVLLSYRAYVDAVARTRTSDAYAASLAYWRGRLADLPGPPELPLVATSSARPDRFTRRVKRIPPETWRAFKESCRHAGLTASVALCAAYATTLAAFSRHSALLVNVMHLNRPPLHPAAGTVVGNFASTALLHADMHPARTFVENARRLQRRLFADLDHASVSGMIVAREPARARAPVVFASSLDAPGARRVGWLDHLAFGALQTPHVWLDHQVLEDGGSVVLNWDAVEELFPPGLLDAAFVAYGALVDRLAAFPHAWSTPPSLLPDAHARLVDEANSTARETRQRPSSCSKRGGSKSSRPSPSSGLAPRICQSTRRCRRSESTSCSRSAKRGSFSRNAASTVPSRGRRELFGRASTSSSPRMGWRSWLRRRRPMISPTSSSPLDRPARPRA